MKRTANRGLALLMALVMVFSLLPVMNITANAATVDYVYSSDGKYIYNWGTRGTVATFLSPNAEAFYEDYSYDALSKLAGGTGTSNAPSSALYDALKTLMTEKHTHITDYGETRYQYCYTDCQGSGLVSKGISAFYSGNEVGPDWDEGNTWNREHTWPNSKGDASGKGEDDIMMLRPAVSTTNSSRGNKAYGKSTNSDFYDPNSVSGGVYNLHGDVARIMLYVYVRWGNTGKMWGSDGVIESLDVLLEWMEEDPVDTWELGRNDSVESITGTRNVFVDYPELAFQLFGEDMPTDMTTPSGEAKNVVNCQHNYVVGTTVAPTCTAKGYTTYTCGLCQKVKNDDFKDMIPHNYVDGKCTECQDTEVLVPEYVTSVTTDKAYKLGLHSTSKNSDYYFTGTMSGYYGATATDYAKGVDLYLEETTGGYYLYFINSSNVKQYINLVASGTYTNFTYGATATSVFTWDADKDALCTTVGTETCYMGTYGTYVTMGVLKTSLLKDTDYIARLYVLNAGSGETPVECTHANTQVLAGKEATCTEAGLNEGSKCTDCGKVLVTQTEIPATGHNYVDGTCTGCGQSEQAAAAQVTISFADKANRTSSTTTEQVWEQNGITFTYQKGSYNNNLAEYENPLRLYAGTKAIIAYPGMTKIVFDCNDGKPTPAENLKTSIGTVDGVTVTVSGLVATVEFATAQDSFIIEKLSAQTRLNSITVYAEAGDSGEGGETACTHEWTDATCTAPKTCSKCGVTEGEALGHTWVDATCKAPKTCSVCNATEGEKADHNYVDGTCSVCGEADPNAGGEAEKYYIAAKRSSGNYFYMTSNLGTASTKRYQAVDSGLTALPASITDPQDGYVFVLEEQSDGTYKIYADGVTNGYLCWSSGNSGNLGAESGAKVLTLTENSNGSVSLTFLNGSETRYLSLNATAGNNYFAFYKPGQTNNLYLIPVVEAGESGGESGGEVECSHDWTDATCTAPKTCSKCGATEGEVLGHNWVDATCTAPKTCSKCGATEGEVLGHSWVDATCKAPKTCSVCSATEGTVADHSYTDGTCTVCGEADPNAGGVNYYTISLDAKGGTLVTESVETDAEGKVSELPTPTREGYTFGGWYTDAACTTAFDITSVVTADITLYAKWTVNKYTVSFEVDGIEDQEVAYNGKATEPTAPTKTGYTFGGWYTDAACTTAYDFNTLVTADITLYAKWTKNAVTPVYPSIPSVPSGTTTTTTKNEDGSTTTTKTDKTTGTVTETTKHTNGTTATVTTASDGTVKTEVTLSTKAVAEAVKAGEAVELPIEGVTGVTDSAEAATITINVQSGSNEKVSVHVPVVDVNESTVVILVNEDGTEKVIIDTKMDEDGLLVDVPDGAVVKIVDNAIDFTDVGEKDWEQKAVNFASARGLVKGVSTTENVFDLDATTTFAQVVTLLAHLEGVDTTPEAGEKWYNKGVAWAEELGITCDGELDVTISRQNMIAVMWRYAGSPESEQDLTAFADSADVTDNNLAALRWAVEVGLVKGDGNGVLSPNGDFTRGQLAQIFMNFVQLSWN